MTDERQTDKRPRRRSWLYALVVSLGLVVLSLGLGLLWLGPGREIDAPPWVRQALTAQLDGSVPGAGVDFGGMRLAVRPDGQVAVALRDVDLRGRGGLPLAEVGHVEANLRPISFLAGKSGLRDISLSGISLAVRRDADGALALAFEEALAAGGAMPGVPELIAGFDAALQSAHLEQLETVTVEAVTLRYEDYRSGRAWTVDGGRLAMTRDTGDGAVSVRGDFALLTGGAGVATVALNASSVVGSNDLELGITVTDVPSAEIATQSAALAWLGTVDAPISGAFRGRMNSDGAIGPVNATLQAGQGAIQPSVGARPIPFDGARSYFAYDPASGQLRFDELAVESEWGRLTVAGTTWLEGNDAGLPNAMSGQFQVSELALHADGLFEAPVDIARSEIDLHLAFDPFELRLGRVWIDDPALQLHLSGRVNAEPEGWRVALDGTVDALRPDAVARFWPPEMKPGTRRWLVNRVETALVHDAQFALRTVPGQRPYVFADFAVSDGVVHFANNIPPLLAQRSRVTIDGTTMIAVVEKGTVEVEGHGALTVDGSQVSIVDTTKKPADGRIDLKVAGGITPLLSVLDRPPMRVMSRARRPVDLASGRAELSGWIAMPFKRGLKGPDFSWDIAGTLGDVSTDKLVPNRNLTSEQLAVRSTQAEVVIRGSAALDGVAMTGSWRQPLGRPGVPGVVLADVPVSADVLQRLGIAFPRDLVRGEGRGALRIDLAGAGQASRFSVTSNLAGLSAEIAPLGWRLGRAQTGKLTVAGRFQQPVQIDDITINAAGMDARGALKLRADGSFDRVTFDQFRLGGWLRGGVTIAGRGKGVAPSIALTGARADLRRAPKGVAGAAAGGQRSAGPALGPLSIALQEFRLTDTIALTDLTGEFTNATGPNGRFRGRVNGGPALLGKVTPTAQGPALALQTRNAGQFLQAAGLLNSAHGGGLTVTLNPRGNGVYDGAFTSSTIRLRDAPAIAGLLDAISIVGMIDQLQGPGIVFSEVEGRFRLTPDQLILSRSSAIGPSMGVSLDGYYAFGSKTLDLQGVLSPLYMLNAIGQIFTRKGEGLAGFTFTVKGTADKPRVRVNPLSLLTPGMFREIFRRPPPKLSN